MSHETDLRSARAVADAVMYEGYLLYPYRASAAKNQIRWQFGVLGPQGAVAAGVGEEPDLATQILVRHRPGTTVTIRLRFLQLQSRSVESVDAAGRFVNVDQLQVDEERWLAWDEAIEREMVVATVPMGGDPLDLHLPVSVEGATGDATELRDHAGRLAGRLVRTRSPLTAVMHVVTSSVGGAEASAATPDDMDVSRLEVRVENLAALTAPRREEALALSLLGAHLLITCESGEFVSLLDPPAGLQSAVDECHQHRCWPVLAGPAGSSGVLLVSPIILEDHPALADESAGGLFDSTEIDEILTLRILTMTDEEKAEARATDPRAAEIIDRSERLTPDEMARMHGVLRDPHALDVEIPTWNGPADFNRSWDDATDPIPTWNDPTDPIPTSNDAADPTSQKPWWDPERDASVDPGSDTVMVAGQAVGRGALVRIHPNRRADAQDIFFANQRAKVTGVHFDVDGATHVGVVLVDDPAADLHEWYGRFLYFAPDELEPIDVGVPEAQWKES